MEERMGQPHPILDCTLTYTEDGLVELTLRLPLRLPIGAIDYYNVYGSCPQASTGSEPRGGP